MMRPNRAHWGMVSIVGAGPGDPGLITVRGKEVLEACDVVVYDSLIWPETLQYAHAAKKIYAGKRGGDLESTPQKKIEALLLSLVKKGKKVVRLKGGDPFVFGRGGEELLYLAKKGIPFEVVPGVSSGTAVPAYAGIPVTHRQLASEVVFITGHEAMFKKSSPGVSWKAVAEFRGTVVLFMGIKMLHQVVEKLIDLGKLASTPVSVIYWGTVPLQKRITGTLATIRELVQKAQFRSPALTVIGDVNCWAQQLAWYEKRPLFGKTVVTTRAHSQSLMLTKRLESLGAKVIEIPAIEIKPITSTRLLDKPLRGLSAYDWVVFTSENGVSAVFERLHSLKMDARHFQSVKVAAIGPGTSAKLRHYGIIPDLVPSRYTVKELFVALKAEQIKGKKVLLLRAEIAPEFLNDALKKSGALVSEVPVYRTKEPVKLKRQIRQLIKTHQIDYITFTSSSTAAHFLRYMKPVKRNFRGKLISIGPSTSQTIRKLGFSGVCEAKQHTIPGLVEKLVEMEAA